MLYADLDFDRPPWDQVTPECKDLVQSLLQRDPAQRPTAVEALKHRWGLHQHAMNAVVKLEAVSYVTMRIRYSH